MKVGIYNESTRPQSGLGGSECYAAVLAEVLSCAHEVEFVHHKPSLSASELASLAGVDLARVQFRCVPLRAQSTSNRWRPSTLDRTWDRELSAQYDYFISIVHYTPPASHASRGALIVLFPFFKPAFMSGSVAGRNLYRFARAIFRAVANPFRRWAWRRHLEGYSVKLAISCFSQRWVRTRWDVSSEVLYPPVDTSFETKEKHDLILSVGRFSGAGVIKRQVEMVSTFKTMELAGWEYHCVGAVGLESTYSDYLARVKHEADGAPVHIATDLSRPAMKTLFSRAKIFWHAAGFSEESTAPELFEHFGISTVEAMAAGCVPVIVDRGGQTEIVEHGVSGFLWDSLDELKEFTRLLTNDEPLRLKMAAQARQRAQLFSRERFKRRALALLQLDTPEPNRSIGHDGDSLLVPS